MSDNGLPDPRVAADLSQWSADTNEVFLRVLVACSIGSLSRVLLFYPIDHAPAETVAFHAGVVLASYIVVGLSDWIGSWKAFRSDEVSGIRQQFK